MFKVISMHRNIFLKKFFSVYLLWCFCKWADTVISLHILQCWEKTEEKKKKKNPLEQYQLITGNSARKSFS